MGLDMYLYKRTYVQRWVHIPADKQFEVTVTRGGQPFTEIDPAKIAYITEQVGYWRKANQIHKWFVENCQNGVDNCQMTIVTEENLRELLDLVQQCLDSITLVPGKIHNGTQYTPNGPQKIYEHGSLIADYTLCQELLPTKSGFFFGGTDYDEWYVKDLNDTKTILEACLAGDCDSAEFFYEASW